MKYKPMLFVVVVSICLVSLFPQQKQEEQETKLVEKMTIVNIEVPVRVYHNKDHVDNLKKEDFKLYENGKLQRINGFYILRKKIAAAVKSETYKGRYFVLAFRITHFNDELKNAVNHVFNNLLRDQDQVLLFVNDRTFHINGLANRKFVIEAVFRILSEAAQIARNRILVYHEKIHDKILESRLRTLFQGAAANPFDDIVEFIKNYITIWNEYKNKYLVPDVDNYYNFARYLKDIKKEKWVLNFFQFELFPILKRSGPLMTRINTLVGSLQASNRPEDQAYYRIITRLLNQLQLALNAELHFPSEEVSKIFYKVNATFHSFFIPSTKSSVYEDIEYKRIASDIENALRNITDRTGGRLMFSGKVKSSINKVENKQDILYMLTYSPDNDDKAGKVRVEVNDARYRVEYDDKVRADYIDTYFKNKEKKGLNIGLKNLKFDNHKLYLSVDNIKQDDKGQGRVMIRVRCFAALKDKPVYDNKKLLQVKKNKKEIAVNIGFNWLVPGEYTFLIDVEDFISRTSTSEILNTSIKY